MRTIRNLAWFLLAFSLTVWAGIASAQDLKPAERRVIWNGVTYNDPMAHCMARAAVNMPTAQFPCKYSGTNQNSPLKAYGTEGAAPTYSWFYGYCTTSSGTSCSALQSATPSRYCANGETPRNGPVSGEKYCTSEPPPISCIPGEAVDVTYKIGPVGRPAGSGYYPYYPREPHDGQCNLNCTDAPKSQVRQCFARGGDDFCSYTCERTGNPKSNNEEGNAPAEPQASTDPRKDVPPFESSNGACPKGTVNAGLSHSGIPMCIGTGTDPKNKPPAPPKIETEKTETADDGTKTTTKTETITNSDGSKTTTTTVTITKPDGTKQVDQQKETSKTPTNAPGKDDSDKDDEKYDLCKQNPHLTICQNSSVAGKCGEISCSGDAIQCATLRAAAAMQCQQQKELEDLSKAPGLGLGNAIAQGSDPMQGAIDNVLKGTEIDLSKPALDSSGFVGAGACLAPITMTVVGRSVTASFDTVCQNIQPLRYAIMACAYILVYLLVSRSILQG